MPVFKFVFFAFLYCVSAVFTFHSIIFFVCCYTLYTYSTYVCLKRNVFIIINMSKESKTIKMQVVVREELAEQFRTKAGERLGAKKGTISKAFEDALQQWIKK